MERRRKQQRLTQYETAAYKSISNRLAANVKRLRKDLGIPQDRAAIQCDMPVRLFHQIENSDSNATLTTLARLCAGLNVDVVQLFAKQKRK